MTGVPGLIRIDIAFGQHGTACEFRADALAADARVEARDGVLSVEAGKLRVRIPLDLIARGLAGMGRG